MPQIGGFEVQDTEIQKKKTEKFGKLARQVVLMVPHLSCTKLLTVSEPKIPRGTQFATQSAWRTVQTHGSYSIVTSMQTKVTPDPWFELPL